MAFNREQLYSRSYGGGSYSGGSSSGGSSYEEEEPTLSEYGQSILNMYNSANSETVRTMTPGLTRTVNKQIVNLIDQYKGEGKITDSDVRILIDRLNLG